MFRLVTIKSIAKFHYPPPSHTHTSTLHPRPWNNTCRQIPDNKGVAKILVTVYSQNTQQQVCLKPKLPMVTKSAVGTLIPLVTKTVTKSIGNKVGNNSVVVRTSAAKSSW